MPSATPASPPAFTVGTVPVFGRRILAPMDGLSDLPFRSLCREFGSAMSYSSFVAAGAILTAPARNLSAFDFLPRERPVVFQIFDDDEARLVEAAKRLLDLQPDILDVNMGCSARCVTGRGAGAGLLREPAKIGRIIAALRRALPIPVTAKIRLGWDDRSRNYLEVARAIEENGGSLVAVHGRTKTQGYSGDADWTAIGEIKASLSIPVIGNGDIRSAQDADELALRTGCDAVMVGRAAIGNPWIFRPGRPPSPSPQARVAIIERHLAAMLAYYGETQGVVLFRKHLARYLDPFRPSTEQRHGLLTETDPAGVRRRLRASVPDASRARGNGNLATVREAIMLEG